MPQPDFEKEEEIDVLEDYVQSAVTLLMLMNQGITRYIYMVPVSAVEPPGSYL